MILFITRIKGCFTKVVGIEELASWVTPLPTGGTTTPRALGLPLVVASGTTITPSAPILVVVCATLVRSIVSLDQEVFARFCKAGTSRTLSNSQIRNK